MGIQRSCPDDGEKCFMRLQQGLGMQACIIQPLLLQYNYMGRRITITVWGLASPFLRILCPTACHLATHLPEPWLTDRGCGNAGAIELFPDRNLYFESAKPLTHMEPFSATRLPPTFQIRSNTYSWKSLVFLPQSFCACSNRP